MKILHLCLGCFYIDNYSYQENLLPKFHKEMGLEVYIIASLVSFNSTGAPCYLEKAGSYINENGIPVKRLNYRKTLFKNKIKLYCDTYSSIDAFNPDIIFIHGCQSLDIINVVRYLKKHPDVKVYVDNHADFSNSASGWVSKNILHKIIWRYCAKIIEPYTIKFWGVLPARVAFLKDLYKLPPEKVDLLVMGAEDEKVEVAKTPERRKSIRESHNIKEDDFLIVTGGKIDSAKKQTILLMDAIKQIENDKIKLILFGSITEELKNDVLSRTDKNKIQYIGWLDSDKSYEYFASSDLVVFPGRHSVFWEQVAGVGIPLVVKHWNGTTHVDLGGNCKFLYEDSVDEMKKVIETIVDDKEIYGKMKKVAVEKGMETFSYRKIAEKSIGLKNDGL